VGEAVLIIVVEMIEGIGTCDVVVVVTTMMTDGQPIAGMTMIIGGMITMIVDMTIIDGDLEWERKGHQETILTSLAVLKVGEEIPN
jgi:hypothetical protein